MDERRRLVSALALALVLAAAAGRLALDAESTLPAALVVVVGGCVLGGLLPGRWWLGVIVGLGVPATQWWAPAAGVALDGAVPEIVAWIAPALSLAAAGLGATLLRHLREE